LHELSRSVNEEVLADQSSREIKTALAINAQAFLRFIQENWEKGVRVDPTKIAEGIIEGTLF
jgi:hypothetical protein